MAEIDPASQLRRRSNVSAIDHAASDIQPAPLLTTEGISLAVPTTSLNGTIIQNHDAEPPRTTRDATPSDVSRNSFDDANKEYFEAANPQYDDRNTIVERHLVARDILALVFNKMVGTGIFVAPALTLALTQSPAVSIAMWVAGGIYTALGLLIYIEYGTRFPYNGGELVYLDRIYKPGFLFTIFFAGYNICFGNTTGNAVQFGLYVVLSGLDTSTVTSGDPASTIDYRIVKLIAWVALTLACGVLYLLPRTGMFLNKILALFKVILLIVVFAKGFQHSYGPDSGRADVSRRGDSSFVSNMSAMVYVIYSYTGWENGNYVAGEIRDLSDQRASSKLLKGSMSAVLLTTILYVLVVVTYYLSTPYEAIVQGTSLLGLGEDFAPKVFGGNGQALNILVAISAFGNLIAVVYTSAKIKQAIARQRFIPLWNWIEMDRMVPKGGLVLHWITTTIWILALPIQKDGYGFIVGISTYGRVMIETAVFAGLLLFYWRKRRGQRNGAFVVLHSPWLQVLLPFILIAFNGLVLVVGAMEVRNLAIPRYWWPAVMGMVFLGSFLYWGVIQLLQTKISGSSQRRNSSVELQSVSQVALSSTSPDGAKQREGRAWASFLGFRTFEVYQWTDVVDAQTWPVRMKGAMEESQADGSRRRVDAHLAEPPLWISTFLSESRKWISKHFF